MLTSSMCLQLLLLITLIFFINSINILTLWYLAGIYLIGFGFFLLLDTSSVLIGFLWVIDLGVGLIFFIFILHFSNFLYQKSFLNLPVKFFFFFVLLIITFIFLMFFFSNTTDSNFNVNLHKIWFFFLSWYDYYSTFTSNSITELNFLREIYFYSNSLGFFIINFVIFYGIVGSIVLCFLIKRVFSFLSLSQLTDFKLLNQVGTSFFIRTQNFIKQQNTSTGTRVWLKHKKMKI